MFYVQKNGNVWTLYQNIDGQVFAIDNFTTEAQAQRALAYFLDEANKNWDEEYFQGH